MRKVYALLMYPTLFIMLTGCSEENSTPLLQIVEEKILEGIPSGSGIVIKNDLAYIIGDDATGVYQLNLENYEHKKIAIVGMHFQEHREPREVKHDFESAGLFTWERAEYLLAFGSGSSSPSRDSLLMVKFADPLDTKIVSLQKFYEHLNAATGSATAHFNLEGATVVGDRLILLNRGNNYLIKMKLNDFTQYLVDSAAPIPEIEYHKVKLPSLEKHEARLSGVCTLNDNHLLFSASVEDTDDWTKDGPVLGSFIGIYSLRDSSVVSTYLLEGKPGIPLKAKIESLDILRKDANGDVILIAIGDNDNGTTNLFKLKLQIPPKKTGK